MKKTNPISDEDYHRIRRGGGCYGSATVAGASYRINFIRSFRDYDLGFRLVRNK